MFSIAELHNAVKLKKVEFQKHALKRLIDEDLSIEAVLQTILAGEVIKEYIEDRPYPSVLILGYWGERPVHIVCAFNEHENKVHIITNYQPTHEYYEPDFKTRRKIE